MSSNGPPSWSPEEEGVVRTLLLIALVAGVVFAPLSAQAESKLSLKCVNVDLPPGDDNFPSGPGADAVNNNCLACHSADMVLNQPALPKVQWEAEVDKMSTAYKAPIDPKDVGAILDYLVSIKGGN
jgi:mono/diheme cytochrome c family protein